jgi:salicylate hydroxylase
VVQVSSHQGQKIFHLHDGPRQKERDRQLIAWQDRPHEGYQNRWRDPVFQKFLFEYDAQTVVDEAWKVYEEGRYPDTVGKNGADEVEDGVVQEGGNVLRQENASRGVRL